MLFRTSISTIVVRCHSTSFCLKASFTGSRFSCFLLIRILCRFRKFAMTYFLMIAPGSLVTSRFKFRALDQIQLKSIREPFDRASLNFLNKTLQRSKYFRAGLIFKLFFVFRNCSPHNLFTILEPLNNLKYSVNILSILIWIFTEIYSTEMKNLTKIVLLQSCKSF